jgi:integrase
VSDWRQFESWRRSHGLVCLPAAPETAALYLTALAADHKPASLQRKLTSITKAHQAAGFPTPASMAERHGQRDPEGDPAQPRNRAAGQRAPAHRRHLEMLDSLDDGLLGWRDRALLLVGFAGGFRRSELVSLDVGDVSETADGLVVRARRSKTDPEAKGLSVALPYGSTAATVPGAQLPCLDRSGRHCDYGPSRGEPRELSGRSLAAGDGFDGHVSHGSFCPAQPESGA